MASSSNPPNATLYVNNLNDKVHKDELKSQLHALFATYGKVVDIVASKSPAMRGQAFLVFSDLTGATAAMRSCEGMVFYDKPMHIAYAKTKSYATQKREDPNFVPPNSVNASDLFKNGAAGLKRARDESPSDAREAKRKADDSDEEMEIDDDDEDEAGPPAPTYSSEIFPPQVHHPTSRLFCTNLPGEVTDSVLSVLFQPKDGFISLRVSPTPTPNAAGETVKVAQALFKNPELATLAKDELNGFNLKQDWRMTVVYI